MKDMFHWLCRRLVKKHLQIFPLPFDYVIWTFNIDYFHCYNRSYVTSTTVSQKDFCLALQDVQTCLYMQSYSVSIGVVNSIIVLCVRVRKDLLHDITNKKTFPDLHYLHPMCKFATIILLLLCYRLHFCKLRQCNFYLRLKLLPYSALYTLVAVSIF